MEGNSKCAIEGDATTDSSCLLTGQQKRPLLVKSAVIFRKWKFEGRGYLQLCWAMPQGLEGAWIVSLSPDLDGEGTRELS